jgi:hypothetical protein
MRSGTSPASSSPLPRDRTSLRLPMPSAISKMRAIGKPRQSPRLLGETQGFPGCKPSGAGVRHVHLHSLHSLFCLRSIAHASGLCERASASIQYFINGSMKRTTQQALAFSVSGINGAPSHWLPLAGDPAWDPSAGKAQDRRVLFSLQRHWRGGKAAGQTSGMQQFLCCCCVPLKLMKNWPPAEQLRYLYMTLVNDNDRRTRCYTAGQASIVKEL